MVSVLSWKDNRQKTVATWIENEEKYRENTNHHHLSQHPEYENVKK